MHGILGQRHLYWNLFRHRLELDGFSVHEVALPFVLLGDIRKAAQALAAAVEDVAPQRGDKVDIVAHSAGGLVSRYYVQRLGGNQRVENLVLLGTPHHGTLTSYLMPVLRIAAQSMPGSSLLDDLNRVPPPPEVRITNFWSRLDGIVIPAENSVLRAPGVRNVQMPRMHHWGFLLSTSVCDQVKRVLARPAPRRRPAK